METLLQDIRYALRGLARTPGFVCAVVVTLALGIGANTTMFGVLDVLLLRPPAHVERADRVVRAYFRRPVRGEGLSTRPNTSLPAYESLRDGAPQFASVAVLRPTTMSLGRGPEARQVAVTLVTHTFFPTLGVAPALGRFFGADEDRVGAQGVAVVSYGFWQGRLGGDRTALGRPLRIGRGTYTVIGVAPSGFTGVDLAGPDVWLPVYAAVEESIPAVALTSRDYRWVRVIARLRDGVRAQDAGALATLAFRRAAAASERRSDTLYSVLLGPVQAARGPSVTSDTKVSLWIGGVAALVLLVACANVANLLLARGIRRRREIAIRLGLGAGRNQVLRLLVVESMLLGLAGGAAALLVAVWGGALVRGLLLPGLSDDSTVLDWRVLAFTASLSLLAGLLAGVAPALRSSRADLSHALRSGARDVTTTRVRLRGALLAAQVAFTLVLLVGAGLFVRSLRGVQALDLGVDLVRVLRAQVDTRAAGLDNRASNALYMRLLERARTIPGVEHAAATVGSPFGTNLGTDLRVSGRDSLPQLPTGGPFFNAVTPEYFAALGIRIVRGRGFTEADGQDSARVTVVGQTFARLVWPGEDPVGKCLYVGDDQTTCVQVVGVVSNARLSELVEGPVLQYYLPVTRGSAGNTNTVINVDGMTDLLIRTRSPARDAAAAVQRALQGAEPGLPYVRVETLDESVAPLQRSWRMGATMFTAFGLLALAIAAVGVFGVTAYTVSQRTREIGVRIALGAQPRSVVRLVLRQGIRAAVAGAAVGLLGALALGRAVASLLYGVAPADPLVLGAVTAALLTVATLAAWLPARRAARVDPIIALQAE